MPVKLTCPICGRDLGPKESLMITHDLIGSLIVHHMIPADVSIENALCDLNFALKRSEVTDVYSDTPMRDYCGEAGFKELTLKR